MVKPKLLDQVREAVRSGISAIEPTRHYYLDQESARGGSGLGHAILLNTHHLYPNSRCYLPLYLRF